eukprot:852064-Amphidinium_carterae.2
MPLRDDPLRARLLSWTCFGKSQMRLAVDCASWDADKHWRVMAGHMLESLGSGGLPSLAAPGRRYAVGS